MNNAIGNPRQGREVAEAFSLSAHGPESPCLRLRP